LYMPILSANLQVILHKYYDLCSHHITLPALLSIRKCPDEFTPRSGVQIAFDHGSAAVFKYVHPVNDDPYRISRVRRRPIGVDAGRYRIAAQFKIDPPMISAKSDADHRSDLTGVRRNLRAFLQHFHKIRTDKRLRTGSQPLKPLD